MGRLERTREIAQRRKRRAQLTKIRAKYAVAKSQAEKDALFAKARKMSPFIELEPQAS